MSKTVVIVGALDTKGQEFAFVKKLIEAEGVKTLSVDFGTMGAPGYKPDVDREEVAKAGGGSIASFADGKHKDTAMQTMANGLAKVVRKLYDEGKLDGIIGMGGSGGTSIATTAMRTLPVGVPKLMVSTIGVGDVSAFAGSKDITFMPSIVDVAGINSLSSAIYTNAAGAIAGMVKVEKVVAKEAKPLIVASMFGNTTTAVGNAREILEKAGYEVLIFHATGSGGKTMESLITDGDIVGSCDITTTELADEVCGGILSAGPERGMAASRAGIPAVIVPGCVDMCNFGGVETIPAKYQERNLYKWNPNVTLMRTSVEENITMGKMLAAAANASTAPVAFFFPLKGVSQLDSPGGQYWDTEADRACYDTIKKNLKPGITVYEMDNNINDPEFSSAVANKLLEFLGKK